VIEATPWSRQPTHLIHDRDAVHGAGFDSRLSRLGIADLRTPVRSPKANAIAERLVRTIRNECLDHIIVFNERHLRGVLRICRLLQPCRPHRSLRLASPVPASVASIGEVASRPVLGGLHHVYYRAA
jgi:transposase InsO family protein